MGELELVGCDGVKSNWRRCLVSGVGLMFLVQSATVSAQASEAGLRVAFVYNFLKFIEWPNLPANELFLCALGARGTTRHFLAQIDNKRTQTLNIKVLFLDEASGIEQELGKCHLVYVPTSGADMPLPAVIPAGMLLVVDEPEREDGRVGISLNRTHEDRIEFTINDPAVRHAGVKISSQLLKLAKNKPGGPS